MLSVAIIARDEERHIAGALASVAGLAAEVVVLLDDRTRDGSAAICRAHGARVLVEPWRGFPAQRNYALDVCRGDWVLFLDGDERVTPELRDELRRTLANSDTMTRWQGDKVPIDYSETDAVTLSPSHLVTMSLFIAIIAAAIPTAIYSMLLWWLDRYEKEPLPLILAAFLWGSLPAIGLAVLFELVLPVSPEQSPLVAPLVEEPIKALALLGLFFFARREFDGTLDGIVYGALVGFGFSMTENVLYFQKHIDDLGVSVWVRGVLFGLNHAFFTSITGLALGPVRYDRTRWRSVLAFLGGLALAILFHEVHNFVIRFQIAGLFFSWLIQSGGVIVVLAIAVLAWRHERRWMEQELGDEVRAGVLSPDDYADILSSLRRMRRQFDALLAGGWPRYRRVRRLHHLATKLAFCKSQLRLADRFHTCDDREHLRKAILALRATLDGEEPAWGKL